MKYWQNETPLKSNISCEKNTKTLTYMTKQKLFSKKKKVEILITTHLDAEGARWPRTKLFN